MAYDTSEVTPLDLNSEKISEYNNDPDFNYVEIKAEETWWTKFKDWLYARYVQFMSWLFGDYEGSKFLLWLVHYLPYIILSIIVVFIVWLFIRLNPGGRFLEDPDASEVFLSDDEDIIKHQDIPQLIQMALSNKNYRLAVRYYYLLLLKKLTDSEIINYQFDKTNSDYLKEIENTKLKDNFKDITRIYDFIWYGNFDIAETDYKRAAKQFNQLEKQL